MMGTFEDYKKTMVAPVTLWSAAKENDVALLERLCAEPGVNLDAQDPRGYSPLMLAAYSGCAEAVALLLKKGANPNSVDNAGNSVLMGATFKDDEAIVRQLIAAGADVKVKNHAGLDARGFAQLFGRTALLTLV